MKNLHVIDCTLRDGGYYNSWHFSRDLIKDYLTAMASLAVDTVEIGFRSFARDGFFGACKYSTDSFIRSLRVPKRLQVAVMVNASDFNQHPEGAGALRSLFCPAEKSPVQLVRIAAHLQEVPIATELAIQLKTLGYRVAVNLMQITEYHDDEILTALSILKHSNVDALYFADSLGSLDGDSVASKVRLFQQGWSGPVGIHAHDNLGNALSNTLRALREGATWLDCTVCGMGRGAGNAKTEYLMLEFQERTGSQRNIAPIIHVIDKYFKPLHDKYGWGPNPFFYLAGKLGIHPTYIQEMISDPRYSQEDILAVIDHLKQTGGQKFSPARMEEGRHFYSGSNAGSWSPVNELSDRTVLVLGSGPGIREHKAALENYIREQKPFVVGLNTQSNVDGALIQLRAACHPVRLLADCEEYSRLGQPLVTPVSTLPSHVLESLGTTRLLDFGMKVNNEVFQFGEFECVIPKLLVIAYALAIATSGNAKRIVLAGFDGYSADDPRSAEMDRLLDLYQANERAVPLEAITPTRYRIKTTSVYAF